MTLRRIKTINSYAGLARWLRETKDTGTWLARVQVADIPSPYSYSPSKNIIEWNDKKVVWFEVRHKRYEVFEVPAHLLRFKSDDEATNYHIRFNRNR